ncbi:uncharacterized protein LOC113086839, partial [Tachysurus ichikawai]
MRFLRFGYQGVCYEFTVLPFGLALSPRTFCLCEACAAENSGSQDPDLLYIDDWLIIADSRKKVIQNTARVLSHIAVLGFRVNVKKSNFTPAQEVIFLGLELNSVTMHVCLSRKCISSFMSCRLRFREGVRIQYRTCLRLQSLMASAIHVLPLGLLRMRAFMKWILSLRPSPLRDLCRYVTVTRACTAALHHWRAAEFYAHETPLRAIMLQKVGHHVLVRCDNRTAVAHINRQGSMRSSKLHALAHKLLVWSTRHFLSLWATHIPGFLNRGADLLSRGNPLYGEWRLHPQIVRLLWKRFGQTAVDLFASCENAHCPMFFSLREEDAPLGVDALAHPWPSALLYTFPPLCLISPTLARVCL